MITITASLWLWSGEGGSWHFLTIPAEEAVEIRLESAASGIRRITEASSLPLLVDADTGWGGAFNIARTVRSFIKAGAAGFHIEDQVQSKRCGHRPGKEVVSRDEMVDRIKACVDARTDDGFVIMARSDALASHGFDEMLDRLVACVAAGADAVFPEAITDLAMRWRRPGSRWTRPRRGNTRTPSTNAVTPNTAKHRPVAGRRSQ
jgi:2-methylisocitrate lyase-like PEP mutase family enzyme